MSPPDPRVLPCMEYRGADKEALPAPCGVTDPAHPITIDLDPITVEAG
jgi:hypothetical protein